MADQPPFLDYRNGASTATFVCAGESAAAPSQNLATDNCRSEPFLTSVAADVTIGFGWDGADAPYPIAGVCLHDINFGGEGTVTVSLSNAYGIQRQIVLEPPVYEIEPEFPASASLPQQRLHYWTRLEDGILVPDPISGITSGEITLSGAATIAYWRVGTLALMPLWMPKEGLSRDQTGELVDRSTIEELTWGRVRVVDGGRTYRETVAVATIDDEDHENWLNLYDQVGRCRPILWIPRPTAGMARSRRREGGLRRIVTQKFSVKLRADMPTGPGRDRYDVEGFGVQPWG